MDPAAKASLINNLGESANKHVRTALASGAPVMISRPETEPGLVAAVHLGAIPAIASSWRTMLTPHRLKAEFTAVFCHQSPMVCYRDKTGNPRRCELADLLIVIDAQTPWFNGRRAVLIQAKMAAGMGTVSPTGISSLTQLELYQHWPLFDFEQSSYGLHAVNLKYGADYDQSGSFGIIDRHWGRSAAPKWQQLPSSPTPSKTKGFPELGTFMARMIGASPNYGRDADPAASTPWSKTIKALLRENASSKFRHRKTLGGAAHPRTVLALAMSSQTSFRIETDGIGDGPPGIEVRDGEPSGISTIHIEVSETPREEPAELE